MAQGGSISGVAIASATAGSVLIYAALRDVTPMQAVKDILSRKPAPVANAGAVAGAIGPVAIGAPSASGRGDIASAARKYLGVKYTWGGASPITGFDCSGLVTWVLAHDLGMKNLPDSTHTVTGQFLIWKGATTVSGPPIAGDLICWTGHIAIASGNGMMIEAPHVLSVVREVKLRLAGATIRRVKG